MQDATNHISSKLSYVEISMKDQLGNPISCGSWRYTAWWLWLGWCIAQTSCNVFYKPWRTLGVNLSPYIGQTITIEITNVDCSVGEHWTQSFWDFQCKPNTPAYCTGQQIPLCGGNSDPSAVNYSYQWYKNGNAIPTYTTQCISVTPVLNDTFMVYVQPPSLCNFYQVFIPTDTCLASINNFFTKKEIKISPNPFSTQTTLHSSNLLKNATLTLYNCFGQEVKQLKNISGQTVTLFRDNLPSGIYFYKLSDSKEFFSTGKIIISD